MSNDSKALSNDSVWSLDSRNWKIIIQRYVAHSISIINVGAHYLILISCYLFSCLCNFHFFNHTTNKILSIGISIDSHKISGIGGHQVSGIGIDWNFGIGTSLQDILMKLRFDVFIGVQKAIIVMVHPHPNALGAETHDFGGNLLLRIL